MAEVRAFPGLRYDERLAGPLSDLICPPYDVISPAERTRLAGRNERNVVRVELPEPTADGYRGAAALLAAWRTAGALRPDAPSLYLHDHDFTLGGVRATRRGAFVALRLHELSEGVVLPHERTFPKAKADRLELLRATRTNTSPIFGLLGGTALGALHGAPADDAGSADFDGDAHRLRRVSDAGAIRAFLDAVRDERVYIADGHHRYETALAYASERKAPRASAERFVLTYLCALDDPGLRIMGTHRVVRGGAREIEAAIARSFDATPIERGAMPDGRPRMGDGRPGTDDAPGIVLAREGTLTRLEPRTGADLSTLPEAWRRLPVAIAEELLLRGAREAGAEISYEHETERAIDAARGGASAILIRAVDPATLRSVADAGERLPQKTTYFYPKVPTGLVLRAMDLG